MAPGPTATTDADLERHIRNTGACIFHPVGTCRMGPGEDAVVGADLRVHGLRALRVVDGEVDNTYRPSKLAIKITAK